MKAGRPGIFTALIRLTTLRCPVCGRARIIERPFKIAEECSSCRAVFKREEGFFVGALLINIVTTELVILIAYMITIPFLGVQSQYALPFLFVIAVTFPLAFYHHSWSLWLTFDHFVESLPKA